MDLDTIQKSSGNYNYSISGINFDLINEVFVHNHSSGSFIPEGANFLRLHPESIEINSALFTGFNLQDDGPPTWVIQQEDTLLFSCPCHSVSNKLCRHQAQAFYNIIKRKELRVFFDKELRRQELKKFAEPYGLQHEQDIEQFFNLNYESGRFKIKPASPGILPVSVTDTLNLSNEILSGQGLPIRSPVVQEPFVVFKQHKYYKHLVVELYEATAFTQNGKPKNPISRADVAAKIMEADTADASKFFFGIHRFHDKNTGEKSPAALEELKAVLKNPLKLKFYQHKAEISENVVTSALVLFPSGKPVQGLELSVLKKRSFFEVTAFLNLVHARVPLHTARIRYDYFFEVEDLLHVVANLRMLKLATFFNEHGNTLLIHQNKFEEFRESFLAKLEQDTEIRYEYLPPATAEQIKEHHLDRSKERFIYLKDSDPYVELDLVMKYGDSEISILSKKQIYPKGIPRTFLTSRDYAAEADFAALIIKQHSHFREQAEDALPYFYLHKKHFLDEAWFLKTFEEWRSQGIEVLGFNKIKDNLLNPNPAKITVRVLSGLDWFNADIDVKFGKKRASLKQINKAIRNKNRYVSLDDGTLGMLPQEWLQKFADYFSSGDLEDHSLKIPKSNFSVISQLFEEEMIDQKVKDELQLFNSTLTNFQSILDVPVPLELKGNLRDYQKTGLNWLNFLDDFNFGGCLADDMGLGKTIQIIAFILSLRGKHENNTNLLVVPTSLIFNWQAEIEKFAPSLKYFIHYGASRPADYKTFEKYELIITSYGTLLSDIRYLKNFGFNYVFLDESQNIKNPDSQRYKAACLLKSRNRIVLTGTPVENNSFDLFAQLSFACPGLLGSKQYFKQIFLEPVDQFGDSKRAAELRNKIKPFILRRTKSQVVKELPEKTEMVIYCEMSHQQRAIYDGLEKEFREFICSKTNEELPRNAANVLKGLTRLRQICNSPLLLNDDEIHERASSKIDVLMEQVLSKSAEHKILIFSQFVSMLDLIGKELTDRDISFSYLTGSTKDRSGAVKQFQEDPQRRVFLISLKAGGTGLNLTQADYVYLVDPWWNPAVENQAIDRVYRIGQKKNVVAVRLICPDTVEEKMMHMQQEKKELFDDLISSETTIGKSFSKDELLKLLNTPLA